MSLWLIGVLLIATTPVRAQDPVWGEIPEKPKPPPTFIRIQPCLQGDFCINRQGVDNYNTTAESERDCRSSLAKCRKEKAKPPDNIGWEPSTVILVVVGIVVAAFAGGVVVGVVVE